MFKEAILAGADTIDARSSFDDKERAQYLNASEALTCIRKQWYQKHQPEGRDGPEDWGYARRGKNAERYMVEALQATNVATLFMGEDQVGIIDDERRLSCTPDGLADAEGLGGDAPGWVGVEFKSIDPRTNRNNLPKEEHVRQLQIAMAMFEEARSDFPEMGDNPIVSGMLVYIDASNFNDIIEFRVPLKPGILDQLTPRANRVLDSKHASRLPREGTNTPFKAECKQRCKFNGLCGVDGASTTTGQGRKDAGDLGTQRTSYIAAKEAEAAAKADKDRAAEQIKALLQRAGKSMMQVDDGSVNLTKKAGSVSYAKVVKEHLPDLDLEPYRGAGSEMLTVK